MRNYFTFFILLLSGSYTFAQTHWQDTLEMKKPNPSAFGKGWVIGINAQAGGILKHTVNFKPDPYGIDYAVEVSLHQQTFGARAWHAKYHYPMWGATLILNQFSNVPHLGRSAALIADIQFPLFRTKRAKLYFGLGDGLAYLTNTYDAVNDTINNVIGSHFNEVTQFKLLFNYRISERCEMRMMGAFTHYSNARYTTPNLGINVYTGGIGLQYYLTRVPANFRPRWPVKRNLHLQKNIQVSYARSEFAITGGPKMPSYTIYMGLSKNLGYCNRLNAGLWYEYNKGERIIYDFFFPSAGDGVAEASRFAAIFGDEVLFGRFSISGNVGLYLYQGIFRQFISFQQLGVNYTLLRWNKIKQHEIYTGVRLKTHLGVAEYFDTMIGCRF